MTALPLEKQVCSLDLAKRLKELGVKQLDNSLWAWAEVATTREIGGWKYEWQIVANDFQADLEFVAAFTVAELGEMLPMATTSWMRTFTQTERNWICYPRSDSALALTGKLKDFPNHMQYGATEADARAKMLIYLLENKLVTV